jgi:hypothetical protein
MTTHTIITSTDLRYAIDRSAEYREIVRCRLDGISTETVLEAVRSFAAEVDSAETEVGGAPTTDVWGVTSDGQEFRLFLSAA